MTVQVRDRVLPVTYTRYAVGDQPGRLRPIKAGFACGSMVLFFFFTHIFA